MYLQFPKLAESGFMDDVVPQVRESEDNSLSQRFEMSFCCSWNKTTDFGTILFFQELQQPKVPRC